jgi:hypothetical protein
MLTEDQRRILESAMMPEGDLARGFPDLATAIGVALREIDAHRGCSDSAAAALLLLRRYESRTDVEDDVAEEWSDRIYPCPECEEEHPDDYTTCPRYPAEHDESGMMGTGTSNPDDVRELARAIAQF